MKKNRLHWWDVAGTILGTAVVMYFLCGIVISVHYAIEYRDNPPQGDNIGCIPFAGLAYMAITVIAYPFVAALGVWFQWWLRHQSGVWATRLAVLGLASPFLHHFAMNFWHHVDYAILRFINPDKFS